MLFSLTLSLDENVIEVYNNKNIELLCQDLIDIALKRGWCVGQVQMHYLVLEVAAMGPEGCFLIIAFSNPHPMVGIG